MKNLIIFGFFILSLVFVQFAQAQTVDDVVDKYIAAMGGKEKLLALNSVKMEGSMNVQGYDVSITTTRLQGYCTQLKRKTSSSDYSACCVKTGSSQFIIHFTVTFDFLFCTLLGCTVPFTFTFVGAGCTRTCHCTFIGVVTLEA